MQHLSNSLPNADEEKHFVKQVNDAPHLSVEQYIALAVREISTQNSEWCSISLLTADYKTLTVKGAEHNSLMAGSLHYDGCITIMKPHSLYFS